MEVVLTGHGAYHLKYHIVWVTKYPKAWGFGIYPKDIAEACAKYGWGKSRADWFRSRSFAFGAGNTAQIFNSRRYAFAQKPICVVIARKIRFS